MEKKSTRLPSPLFRLKKWREKIQNNTIFIITLIQKI